RVAEADANVIAIRVRMTANAVVRATEAGSVLGSRQRDRWQVRRLRRALRRVRRDEAGFLLLHRRTVERHPQQRRTVDRHLWNLAGTGGALGPGVRSLYEMRELQVRRAKVLLAGQDCDLRIADRDDALERIGHARGAGVDLRDRHVELRLRRDQLGTPSADLL